MIHQTISSSGIMLTASWQTNLALSVERDESSYKHVISGNLKRGDSGVVGKQVKILVNDTLKATLPTTEPSGQFSTTLDLDPLNNKPASYRIVASFEGDTAHTATAYGITPTVRDTPSAEQSTTDSNHPATALCSELSRDPQQPRSRQKH